MRISPSDSFQTRPVVNRAQLTVSQGQRAGLPFTANPRFGMAQGRDLFRFSRDSEIPKPLQKKIESAATVLYGKKEAREVSRQIFKIIREARRNRPPELLKEDYQRPPDWYKSEQAYMLYPERFGTTNGKPNTFKQLIPMLGYLKTLGVSTVYLLPFMQSPMIDAGFDISDYKQVRPELGGNEEFDAFMSEARKQGFKVKADLVLNHVSDQHPWFQAALNGDPDKLNYFLHKGYEPKPRLERTRHDGTWAIYTEKDGSQTRRRLIFPDASSTHYRKEKISGKDQYFYYTFYPHQVDLNWRNPKVMNEVLGVVAHWANKGVDIFRLDAMPFFVKPPNTTGENSPGTHAVVQILSASLQAISPRSVLWAEACQEPNAIKHYFGEETTYASKIPGQGHKMMSRTEKVQLAYHFPGMSSIWATMLTKNPSLFWETMNKSPQLPKSGEWSNFLRVHDELSMEMYADPQLQKFMYEQLAPNGAPFREGYAVGGRLASFLGNDQQRIKLSNSILYSLPGLPLMYYGDEIGESNSESFMQDAAREREKQASKSRAPVKSFVDGRDIGRAPISREKLFNAMSQPDTPEGQLFDHTRRLIQVRKENPALVKGDLSRVSADNEHTFSYLRQTESQRVLVAHNLSDQPSTTKLALPETSPVSGLSNKGLTDLISGRRLPFKANVEDNAIELTLKPYESTWLELPKPELQAGNEKPGPDKKGTVTSLLSFFKTLKSR